MYIDIVDVESKTTDELEELYYWIKDRQSVRRKCNLKDTSSDTFNEYRIIDELARRGVNVVKINAIIVNLL